jgi:hypothetical protein
VFSPWTHTRAGVKDKAKIGACVLAAGLWCAVGCCTTSAFILVLAFVLALVKGEEVETKRDAFWLCGYVTGFVLWAMGTLGSPDIKAARVCRSKPQATQRGSRDKFHRLRFMEQMYWSVSFRIVTVVIWLLTLLFGIALLWWGTSCVYHTDTTWDGLRTDSQDTTDQPPKWCTIVTHQVVDTYGSIMMHAWTPDVASTMYPPTWWFHHFDHTKGYEGEGPASLTFRRANGNFSSKQWTPKRKWVRNNKDVVEIEKHAMAILDGVDQFNPKREQLGTLITMYNLSHVRGSKHNTPAFQALFNKCMAEYQREQRDEQAQRQGYDPPTVATLLEQACEGLELELQHKIANMRAAHRSDAHIAKELDGASAFYYGTTFIAYERPDHRHPVKQLSQEQQDEVVKLLARFKTKVSNLRKPSCF